MSQHRIPLSPAEWRVLCLVYKGPAPASVFQVAELARDQHYRTVQTLLRRITKKGWLRKTTAGRRVSLYSPVVDLEAAVEERLEDRLSDFLWDEQLTDLAQKAAGRAFDKKP